MADDIALPEPEVGPPVPRRRRRLAWWLGGGTAVLVFVAVLAVAALWWALTSTSGSAWLLTLAPQLKVLAPKGSLLGDFAAERLDIEFPGAGVLRLDAPRWQALSATAGDHGRWLHLKIATLHADRVTWLPDTKPMAANGEPAAPPRTLRLPIEIEVREASVDELRIGSADAAPVRAVKTRVHVGADGGALHRLDELQARVDRAATTGAATIAADAPFAVTLRVAADSAGMTPSLQALVTARGPLDAMNVAANASVVATTGHPAQSIDATAVVRPFAAWPLGELRATLVALDLSAFTSAAPTTSLSGQAVIATTGTNTPAQLSLDLRNARSGRWNEGLLPVTRAVAELRARPDDPSVLDVSSLTAELGSSALAGGRIVGTGRWTQDRWSLDADLAAVRPLALDARAPSTVLSGKLVIAGSGFAAVATRAIDVDAKLAGLLADRRLPKAAPRAAQLRLQAQVTSDEIDLRSAEATLGDARATLAGKLSRRAADAPWRAVGRVQLAAFDPAPWWPGGGDALFARGANRLSGRGDFDVTLPAANAADAIALLTALRGQASAQFKDSVLAGIPFEADAGFTNSDGAAQPSLAITAAGNRLRAEGRLAAAGSTRDDWRLTIDAPHLDALAPLLGALPAATSAAGKANTLPRLAGTLTAKAHVAGRWPDLASDGELQASALRLDTLTVRQASGRWRAGSTTDAAIEGKLTLDDLVIAGRKVEHAEATVTGSARAHRAELRIDSTALPPEWVDTLTAKATSATTARPVPTASAATTAKTAGARSKLTLVAEGGLVDAAGERAAGWRGSLRELAAQAVAPPPRTWLHARDIRGAIFWSGGPLRANVDAGSADVLGATLRWSRIAWQQAGASTPAKLDVQASIDSLAAAPLLAAFQPDFGWGGDLAVAARIDVRSTPSTKVDIVVERNGGDLAVTDEFGSQPLGISELRLGVAADQGVWKLAARVAGATIGVASANVTARATAGAAWPGADSPLAGNVELRIASLGSWGRWVPAGWRLAGELRADAVVAGRFGAPQYTGRVEGTKLGVRNFVEGVNVTDGVVAIALQGTTARIETFTAKAGAGTVRVDGEAAFDDAPSARLRLVAERFELLGRVDRRIVASGNAALRLDSKTLVLDGKLDIDEGLVDFTRSDAPTLGSDVEVVRRPPVVQTAASSPAQVAVSAAAAAASAPAIAATASRAVALDLRVGMGEKLRVRGRGLDAGLRGELRITSPGGRLAVNGTLRTEGGTYQAYGQKLGIDRGVLTFTGPVENPRLDIEATRPDVDVRVGVTVSGTALYPRVRLFSEPDLSDLDKLSWLVLGRASETTGGADTALLQQAALALLSGEGPGVTDRLIKSIGLDAVSVRQSQGAVKDTIVSLGKQISKRWYVGYERGLNTTTGTWQLIYRVAQRVTVRAEAGSDNAIDVNWTLRWK